MMCSSVPNAYLQPVLLWHLLICLSSTSSSIELDISSHNLNRHFMHKIQESEVKDAIKRMNKVMSSDGSPLKYEKCLGRSDSSSH
jgi:hypothetical protein